MNNVIVIEGVDFSGKSTLIEELSKLLMDRDIQVANIAQPSGAYREVITNYLRDGDLRYDGGDIGLFHLFIADRYNTLKVIRNLNERTEQPFIILLDRYTASTEVYQRSILTDTVNRKILDKLPKLKTIILNTPLQTIRARKRSTLSSDRSDNDIFETEQKLRQSHKEYYELAANNPDYEYLSYDEAIKYVLDYVTALESI